MRDCTNTDLVGGQRNQNLYSTVVAEIIEVDRNHEPAYVCCPMDGCLKKVQPDDETGGWKCTKCEIIYPHYKFRYRVTLKLKDEMKAEGISAVIWGDEAESLLGEKPFDLFLIGRNIAKMDEYERIMLAPIGKLFEFTLQTKLSEYVDLEHHVQSLGHL